MVHVCEANAALPPPEPPPATLPDLAVAGHQFEVGRFAREIGRMLGLPAQRLHCLYLGGIIHDIGLVSVPPVILAKPAPLTVREFAIVKTHAEVGYAMLKNVPAPWPIAEIARQHHERLDGSGYPCGLKGAEIMLEARIVAVADIVQAMLKPQPYRPAFSRLAVRDALRQERGRRLDADVVDASIAALAAA